jgi:hypothetical protein
VRGGDKGCSPLWFVLDSAWPPGGVVYSLVVVLVAVSLCTVFNKLKSCCN